MPSMQGMIDPNAPQAVQGPQAPRALAGRFQTPEELEQAYLQSQQFIGQQANEIGTLRNQYFSQQQQMIAQGMGYQPQPAGGYAPPQAPAAAAAPTQEEHDQALFRKLSPVADRIATTFSESMDEESRKAAAWDMVLANYQIAKVAAEGEIAPQLQATQAQQQAFAANLGMQQIDQTVAAVMQTGQYPHLNPVELRSAIAKGIDPGAFLNMNPMDQRNAVEMVAGYTEFRLAHQPAPQPGQLPGQPGFYPQPGMPAGMPALPVGQPGYVMPPQPGYLPMQPPAQYPQYQMPAPYGMPQGFGAPPSSLAPGSMPQAPVDPAAQEMGTFYAQFPSLAQNPQRMQQAVQNASMRMQRGGRY